MSGRSFRANTGREGLLQFFRALTLITLTACQARPIDLNTAPKIPASISIATLSIQQNGAQSSTAASLLTQLPTDTPDESAVITNVATPTIKCPRTLLFYGDSRLGALGVSFVDNIKKLLAPCYNLINASYWAHTAQWGLANLQDKVVSRNPDDVALWWGANDFDGCNGTINPTTNMPDRVEFIARLSAYVSAMKSQIETLSGLGMSVYLFDEPRVNGGLLPWAIVDNNGKITGYDHNHLCSWNWVSDAVALAQKQLVADESAQGQKVTLVDVWQLYMDDGTLTGMYSTDVVHPGVVGREKIAELFISMYSRNHQP